MDLHEQLVLNYRFKVLIENKVVSFTKVSGLGMDCEAEIFQEGGNGLGGEIAMAAKKSVKTLRMEGGVYSGNQSLLKTLKPGICLSSGIVIMVMGPKGQADIQFGTGKAFVTKWEVSDLDAEQGRTLVNTFEIAYMELSVLDYTRERN